MQIIFLANSSSTGRRSVPVEVLHLLEPHGYFITNLFQATVEGIVLLLVNTNIFVTYNCLLFFPRLRYVLNVTCQDGLCPPPLFLHHFRYFHWHCFGLIVTCQHGNYILGFSAGGSHSNVGRCRRQSLGFSKISLKFCFLSHYLRLLKEGINTYYNLEHEIIFLYLLSDWDGMEQYILQPSFIKSVIGTVKVPV